MGASKASVIYIYIYIDNNNNNNNNNNNVLYGTKAVKHPLFFSPLLLIFS